MAGTKKVVRARARVCVCVCVCVCVLGGIMLEVGLRVGIE